MVIPRLPASGKKASTWWRVRPVLIKVSGEGERKVRQHGYSQRRTWRKVHPGVDADTHEVVAALVTTSGLGDGRGTCPRCTIPLTLRSRGSLPIRSRLLPSH